MMNSMLRQKAAYELAKALGNTEKAINYLDMMDAEVKKQQEIACTVDEMMD